MDLLDRWIEQLPIDGDPAETTKQELFESGHCQLAAHFSQLCADSHGRQLQELMVHPWPDNEPGPLTYYPAMIQAGLERLFELLNLLSKFEYLRRINEAYPKKAPLHKIHETLSRDQAGGFEVFKRFQSDIERFWREHTKPLPTGRDWKENQRLAMRAFYDLAETKPKSLTEKVALAFMAERMAMFIGDSTLSGQKLSVFAGFLQRIGADLQAEHTQAAYKLGTHARQSKFGEYGLHDELREVLQPFLDKWIQREAEKGHTLKPGKFFTFLHKGDHGGLADLRTETGTPVFISFESKKIRYHLEDSEDIREITKDNFRHITRELLEKRKEPGSFQKR